MPPVLLALLCRWKSIIDHLLTHEKTMFKDLMSECSLKEMCLSMHDIYYIQFSYSSEGHMKASFSDQHS